MFASSKLRQKGPNFETKPNQCWTTCLRSYRM